MEILLKKKFVFRLFKLLVIGVSFYCFSVPVLGEDIHKSGLSSGEGLDLVLANCTICHSADIIIKNHMSRSDWSKTITWMQEEQGLWELKAEDRKKILDYLETYQGIASSMAISQQNRKRKMYQYEYQPNPLYNY